ncbi:Putative Holliday junction resolvase [Croceitalea dokdonensis DOKDO 023]|uniref:Putative pre-16S rRNA nuclease n=1 Tax=Croceitalea dokdonensis DOKDO 023 TaxID=1300341 RepID=A0A0P7B0Z4_9FLAO|nr:Holliday junction resolvase RuvX [Croceitalea dokdonensis]KPM31610.1 Putative Holliday junction resolvase [Croceitalea dokdonensis DOKDO 023]
MARILALDYGKVRTGIAVTDELQIIASGLTTVATSELPQFLRKYLATEDVERIVIGEPKQMDGTPSTSEALMQPFIAKLEKWYPNILVTRQDERFTSKLAFDSMLASGLGKKKRSNKALVDEISATIILQDYLNRK